ncbi:MAG: NRDE family protein [Betaproteobacteria bacterium]|nr:NRDE family protein [Betaproteobacteria bacterium]
MCLILAAYRVHPEFPLIVAANRDEFHARPAERAAFWQDRPAILAGRDLEALGTWMGVSRAGRFAAVTNFRGGREANALESRGLLVTRFLENCHSANAYVTDVGRRGADYSGFNLLAEDGDELWWCSNRGGEPRRLDAGIYGLGNELLDTPELGESKARLACSIESAACIESLFDVLATARIVAPQYGTRCSTALLRGGDGRIQLAERSYDPGGEEGDTWRFELQRSS